jgi:hypothetical protein
VSEISNSVTKPTDAYAEVLAIDNYSSVHHPQAFTFSVVSPEIVLSTVKNFKPSDSVDIYDISCSLVKKVIVTIVHPLTYCIKCCVTDSLFPTELKLSKVIPLYKK